MLNFGTLHVKAASTLGYSIYISGITLPKIFSTYSCFLGFTLEVSVGLLPRTKSNQTE